ncbi:Cuticle protein [Dufourea novaeangliae]|uniref:Cuticle protein n=1 Tax=Dufourea novaeangliae TaxID=178035 RepID=A0A154P833_DUFNO|nr:Cuticle protein [Dufourea novaeangliae]
MFPQGKTDDADRRQWGGVDWSVGHWGGDLGDDGGVGSVGQRSGVSNRGGGDGLEGNSGGFLADDCVESVDRVSGVVDGALGAVRLDQGVTALYDVTVAGLLLAFGVTGQAIMDIIGVAVLRMGVVFVALAALLATANAGVLPAQLSYAQPAHLAYAQPAQLAYASAPVAVAPVAKALAVAPVAKTVDADYDPHPQYSYAYDVHDSLTGDAKSQQESRDGDVVQGSYSLIEPDGTRRTVDYTADPVNGFNAVVRKEAAAAPLIAAAPVAKLATPVAKIAAPLAYAAPVAKIAAPLAYAAPVAKYAAPLAYAAPVAKIAAPFAYAAPAQVAYSAPAASLSYAAPAPAAYIH